jgi:DNA topoisomerase-2
MKSLSEGDIVALMERRVYDVAACNEKLSVYLNGEKVPNTFDNYIGLYTTNDQQQEIPRVIMRVNERWQVGVGISLSGQFQQVSFVNSICTSRGGTHVNYIADQVAKYLLEQVKKKDKDLKFTPNHIKVKNYFIIIASYNNIEYYRRIIFPSL